MDSSAVTRILLLGKTGVGKSSLANTIFEEPIFQINHLSSQPRHRSRAETKSVNGRSLTLIDTPGFFDARSSEEEMESEIMRCVIECAPGPHALLIVLKVEKFTEHEKAVIAKICEIFTEDSLKCAAVVFTHGDQLAEGQTIEEYIDQSESLSDLVKKCGGRCCVVDNKYWKTNEEDSYRTNQFQVAELLSTIDKMVTENNGGYFSNDRLQEVEKAIQGEEERIRKSSANLSQEEIRQQAKSNVFKIMTEHSLKTRLLAFVGFTAIVAAVFAVFFGSKAGKVITETTTGIIATPIAIAPPIATTIATPIATPIATTITTVIEEIASAVPDVSPAVSVITEAVEPLIQPIVDIPETFENIFDACRALFETTYDPWNPFE